MKHILPLLLFSLIPPAAWGQDERENVTTAGLDVEFAAGWDGLVDRSTPVPLSFLVSNYSGDNIDGELFIVDPINGQEQPLGEVFLSQAARRRLSSVQDLSDWMECFAELRVAGDVVWRREMPLYGDHDFSLDVNFALVLNDSGRALKPPEDLPQQPVAIPSGNFYGNYLSPLAGPTGRPVRYAQMKTWQVPEHEGPLLPVRAVIIPEGKLDNDLNGGQWRAIARWICQGGHLFLSAESDELLTSLVDASPLKPNAPVQQADFDVRRMGLGKVLLYDGKLFAGDTSLNRAMATLIAELSEPVGPLLADGAFPGRSRGGVADWNRLWIVGFCVVYGLFSGLVMLAFARQPKRRVVAYTASVVTLACIASAVLGGSLRMSRGDLQWVSVTEVGAGGAVQHAKVIVQSGGARNTRVALSGRHIDLQATGTETHHYHWQFEPRDVRAFTRQRSLVDDESVFRINVPMTPWGRERLRAVAMQPTWEPLNVDVQWKPAGGRVGSSWPPSGELVTSVRSPLPAGISSPRLLISVAGLSPPVASEDDSPSPAAGPPWQTPQVNQTPEFFVVSQLTAINPDDELTESFPVSFRPLSDRWALLQNWNQTELTLPRPTRENTVRGWLIGTLSQSPILQFDATHSDFSELSAVHLFVHEIDPAGLPTVDEILGPVESRRR